MHSGSSGPASEPFSSTSNTASQPPPVNAPAASGTLDILVAPPVLNHRFVRSRDMRTIVERPERIRAVLLGVAGACARGQITETVLPESAQAVGTSDPGADLADVLAKLSVASSKGSPLFEAPTSSGHIGAYVSSRHLSLTRDNAVNYVHAHEEEEVERTLPEYASAATVVKEEQGTDKAPASSAPLSSHAAYLAELCALAPSSSPVSTAQRGTSAPSTPSKAAHVTHAMASAPNLRDTADPRPSEVPAQLPQGDLYLRGGESGTRAAIEAALGTSAEAVDRVVTAACATTSSPSAQGPLPSPRAFAIVRPPGHHCSGSLPGGFCWVNNVAVAAAHGYLEHGIDRAIILDFDLHHGSELSMISLPLLTLYAHFLPAHSTHRRHTSPRMAYQQRHGPHRPRKRSAHGSRTYAVGRLGARTSPCQRERCQGPAQRRCDGPHTCGRRRRRGRSQADPECRSATEARPEDILWKFTRHRKLPVRRWNAGIGTGCEYVHSGRAWTVDLER